MKKVIINEQQFAEWFLNEERHYPEFLNALSEEIFNEINNEIPIIVNKNQNGGIIYSKNIYSDNLVIGIIINYVDDIEELMNRKNYECEYYNESYLNTDKKIPNPIIRVNIPYYTGNSSTLVHNKYFVKVSLYHEITHLYDDWIGLNNGKKPLCLNDKRNNRINMIDNEINNHNFFKLLKKLNYISYPPEEKAFVAQVFGELEMLNTDLDNYKKQMKKTLSFTNYNKVYNEFNNYINSIDNNELENISNIIKKYKKHGIPYRKNKENIEQYREKLNNWSYNIYHSFIKKFGGIVSLYLDRLKEHYKKQHQELEKYMRENLIYN